MSSGSPTDEQLRDLGAIFHRYMSGGEFAVWGNYGVEDRPSRHLTIDGKVSITKGESDLLDELGYKDSFGNPHD